MSTIIARRPGVFGAIASKLSAAAGALVLSVGLLGGGVANAAGTVSFTSPVDGSSAPAGTKITPTGVASGVSSGGSGLDLVLVLDSSGSMASTSGGISRREAQATAAKALVAALPTAATSVSIVEFDSDANVVRVLTPLTSAANIGLINAAIDGVDASGSTDIRDGINAATGVLTGAGATAGRSKQMVVISDGGSNVSLATAAATAANTAGVNNVHTVAIPGASTSTMEAIANAGNGIFTDLSSSDLSTLQSQFDGTAGNLVGVQSIKITLPDGTVLDPNSIDGLGNFTVDQEFMIAAGANTWTVDATFTDGSTAQDTVTVNGTVTGGQVPLPAGMVLMLGGLGVMGALRARRKA